MLHRLGKVRLQFETLQITKMVRRECPWVTRREVHKMQYSRVAPVGAPELRFAAQQVSLHGETILGGVVGLPASADRAFA